MHKAVKEVAKKLRRYDSIRVLNMISQISVLRQDRESFGKLLAQFNLNPAASLRDCQMAFVSKLVLKYWGKLRAPQKNFTFKDLVNFSATLSGTQTPKSYPLKTLEDVNRFFMRTAYQQFPDFYGNSETLARTHLLFRTCAKEVEKETGFDVDEAFEQATGLTLNKFWEITLLISGLLLQQKHGVIKTPLKPDAQLNRNLSESDVARFLNLISLKSEEYRQKMELENYQVDPFETFNPNPLVNWPVVKIDDHTSVVPIFPYLFRRGTEQAFYDVIAFKDREFSGYFGKVFEAYTDKMLSLIGSNYEIIKEPSYKSGNKLYKTCDRIIIGNGDAVLIECKTKRLGLKTKFTANEELIRNDVTDVGKNDKGNIVHAVRQLKMTEQAIRGGFEGLENIGRKITGQLFHVVLTLDPYYFSNAGFVRRIINEELKKGDYPVEGFKWQLIDANGLEMLCSLSQKLDFMDLIKEKVSSPNLEEIDMTTFIEYENIGGKQTVREIPQNKIIMNELDKFHENLQIRYGNAPKT